MATRLRPTFAHGPARRYRRPGGPWDRGNLERAFTPLPAGAALVDDDSRLSGASVAAAVDTVAAALAAAGVRRGQVVAWQLPNGALPLLLYRACWRLGVVAAPVHHKMGAAEVAAALAQVDPSVLVVDEGLPAAEVAVGSRPALAVLPVATNRFGDRIAALTDRLRTTPGVRQRAPGLPPARATASRGHDLAAVLFTSGSSGRPKAVLHTHRGLAYKAVLMASVHGLLASDAVLMPAPLAHVSGLLNGVLLPAVLGCPTVLMGTWDPERALAHLCAERVTFMGAPPVFFSQMASAAAFSREAVASLRLVSTGGASVSPAFVEATSERFGCRVKRTYGSTEAPTVTTSGPADPVDRARDSDGRVVGEAELRIAVPGTTRWCPAGTEGEILVRGPELFVGYVDPTATAAVRRPGGWFATGDLGVLDTEGWLSVRGRLSDVIIRAGENVSASEVEAVLERHPSVRAAVAVAAPDPVLGERVAAFVEAVGPFDLDTCRRWFAAQGVSRFKTPEHLVLVDQLPVLATGKPDRAALRAEAAALAAARPDPAPARPTRHAAAAPAS